MRLFLLLLSISIGQILIAQNESLIIKSGEKKVIRSSVLEVDTFYMEDASTLTIRNSSLTIIANHVIIKNRCIISGKGRNGRAGKNGEKGAKNKDGEHGEKGGNGTNGKNFNILTNTIQVGRVRVNLNGGRGGNGGSGGKGGDYHCKCGVKNQIGTNGGNGANGGFGGEPGSFKITVLKEENKYWKNSIRLLNKMGQKGTSGKGGEPGEVITKLCTDSWAKAEPGRPGLSINTTFVTQGSPVGVQDFSFPYPPPKASATHPDIPISISTLNNMNDVDLILKKSLRSCGYNELKYYTIPNGFAVVTGIEQIDSGGKPLSPPDRWSNETKFIKNFSLLEYLKSLFITDEGRFRIIVFALTDNNVSTTIERISKDDALAWFDNGWFKLPENIGKKTLTDQHSLTAFIYEFRLDEHSENPILSEPSLVPAKEHLERTGIWKSLNLNE